MSSSPAATFCNLYFFVKSRERWSKGRGGGRGAFLSTAHAVFLSNAQAEEPPAPNAAWFHHFWHTCPKLFPPSRRREVLLSTAPSRLYFSFVRRSSRTSSTTSPFRLSFLFRKTENKSESSFCSFFKTKLSFFSPFYTFATGSSSWPGVNSLCRKLVAVRL